MKLVYFLENTSTLAIKIGVADDPVARVRRLQTSTDCELKLIGVIKPSVLSETTELQLHRRFAEHRLGGRGEWFAPIIRRDVLAILAYAASAGLSGRA